MKPFALSGVSMVHIHPVCEQVTACGLPVSLPSMVTFAVVLPSAGGCPPQPASPSGEHRRGHRNVSGLHVAKLY